jgi:hypothetical protein
VQAELCHPTAVFRFIYWAPWTAAITTEEATRKFPGEVDSSWKAVHVNHGSVEEWRLGTPRQNPWAFTACTVALFGGVGYALAVALVRQKRADEKDVA